MAADVTILTTLQWRPLGLSLASHCISTIIRLKRLGERDAQGGAGIVSGRLLVVGIY